MVYECLERLRKEGLMSDPLCDALGLQVDINDLFEDGIKEDSPQVIYTYEDVRELEEELEVAEILSVEAVAKALWKRRVTNTQDPINHPEYCETMDTEVQESQQKLLHEDVNLYASTLVIINSIVSAPAGASYRILRAA